MTVALREVVKSGGTRAPASFFLLSGAVALPDTVHVHGSVRVGFSVSENKEKACGTWGGVALNP